VRGNKGSKFLRQSPRPVSAPLVLASQCRLVRAPVRAALWQVHATPSYVPSHTMVLVKVPAAAIQCLLFRASTGLAGVDQRTSFPLLWVQRSPGALSVSFMGWRADTTAVCVLMLRLKVNFCAHALSHCSICQRYGRKCQQAVTIQKSPGFTFS
jgi:hypothetical protein